MPNPLVWSFPASALPGTAGAHPIKQPNIKRQRVTPAESRCLPKHVLPVKAPLVGESPELEEVVEFDFVVFKKIMRYRDEHGVFDGRHQRACFRVEEGSAAASKCGGVGEFCGFPFYPRVDVQGQLFEVVGFSEKELVGFPSVKHLLVAFLMQSAGAGGEFFGFDEAVKVAAFMWKLPRRLNQEQVDVLSAE
jgi:hypothetical protein